MVVLAVLLAARSVAGWDAAKPENRSMDLRAFWCAGRAVAAKANPYLTEPLRSCEHDVAESLLRRWPNAVLPFVHPGYDAAAFAALSRVPFELAAAIFLILALAALVGSVWLLMPTLELPWPFVTAALVLPVGLSTFLYGQVAAFELLFIAASAAALVSGRDRLAGLFASLTLFEPHIGLFVVLALAVTVPRARLALVTVAALLGGIAIVTTGPVPQMMWLAQLGQQALAEARYEGQYSLTYLLTLLGVPARAALALGAVSTLALVIAGVIAARAFAARGERAAVVLVPAAFAVAGGTFVHLTQIALAIPAALFLYRIAKTPLQRSLAAASVVLLSVPWPSPAFSKQMLGFALVTLAVLVWHVSGRSLARTLTAIAASWIVLATLENHPPPAVAAPVVHRAAATAPATATWAELVGAFHGDDPARIIVKVPTWCGVLLLLISATLAVRERRAAG